MNKISILFRTIAVALTVSFTLSLAGCGTLIYPDRRGQTGGRIDPAIAILDGIGLLVFIVPGLIAFAVDFATGAIYLPGTRHTDLDGREMKVVSLPPGEITPESVAAVIERETGEPFSFTNRDLQAWSVDPEPDVEAQLKRMAGQPQKAVLR